MQDSSQHSRDYYNHPRQDGSNRNCNPELQHLHGRRSDHDTDTDDGRIYYVNMPSRGGGRHGGSGRYSLQPQDDNGETTTVVTGATSDVDYSSEDLRNRKFIHRRTFIVRLCARYFGAIVTGIISLIAFLSPLVMIVLPKTGAGGWYLEGITFESEGVLIAMSFKLFILLAGTWALFLRQPKATFPRIFISRAVVVSLTFVITLIYWLFYGMKIFNKDVLVCGVGHGLDSSPDNTTTTVIDFSSRCYQSVVGYSSTLVDVLLFIHYLAVILIELKSCEQRYVVKILRSPDGEVHSYTVGQLSIQRLAVWCLQHYHADFQVYNPYLESLPRRSALRNLMELKVYGVDGVEVDREAPEGGTDRGGTLPLPPQNTQGNPNRGNPASTTQRRRHNERFYEELDLEQRIRRRKARLVVAAGEAFGHVRQIQEESESASAMDAEETAQAIFPTFARQLQKYLKAARVQPYFPRDLVLDHLTICLAHGLSHKSFLSRFFVQGPVIWNDLSYEKSELWSLVSDLSANRSIEDGMSFELTQGDISLLVSIRRLPHLSLIEEEPDGKGQKFVLRMNTETRL